MGQPGLILHLKVPLDVAIERNRKRIKADKESTSELKLRYEKNKNLEFSCINYYMIDSNSDYSEVLAEIKGLIWKTI